MEEKFLERMPIRKKIVQWCCRLTYFVIMSDLCARERRDDENRVVMNRDRDSHSFHDSPFISRCIQRGTMSCKSELIMPLRAGV